MAETESSSTVSPSGQWQLALSRWENEGGAVSARLQQRAVSTEEQPKLLDLTNAELVQLGSVHTVMQQYVHALHRGPARKRAGSNR